MPSGLLGNQIESKRKKEPTWGELFFKSHADLSSAGENSDAKTYVFLTLSFLVTQDLWGDCVFNQAHLEAGLDVSKCTPPTPHPATPILIGACINGKGILASGFLESQQRSFISLSAQQKCNQIPIGRL